MKERMVRVRLSDELYKKFKMICVNKDLSITKQIGQIVEGFIKIQEENDRMMMQLHKGN
jgi:predicted transcriptional regulator YheO